MKVLNLVLVNLAFLIYGGQSNLPELRFRVFQNPVVFNPSEAPVRLSLSPNEKYIVVTNYSDKEVKALTLGCVVDLPDGPLVKKTIQSMKWFDLAQIDLAPADVENSRLSMFAFPVTDESVTQCQKKAALFAVIEARFADGSSWKIPARKK